jgi:hypothetical protein
VYVLHIRGYANQDKTIALRTGTITPEKVRESMTNAEKRDRIRQSLADHPEWSNRRHAEALGLSAQTVGAVRAQVSAKLERPELVREANGRLVALVDLVIEASNGERLLAAGFEVPPELRDLPRRAAGEELVDLHGELARRQREAEEETAD